MTYFTEPTTDKLFLCPNCMDVVEVKMVQCSDDSELYFPVCAHCHNEDLEEVNEEQE